MRKVIFMETTKIEPSQTVGEIQKILGHYGASAIRTDYEKGEVVSVLFTINLNGDNIPFRLPCRWEAILQTINSRKKRHTIRSDWEGQAKRVAWRQILRWIEAQLALTETGMARLHEVFMPYLLVDKGQTLFEKFESQGWKFQLEHKK